MKWLEFQSEINQSHVYYVQQESTLDDLVVYNVSRLECSTSKPMVLTCDRRTEHISCSCKKFEFEGIPCRHMLAFFRVNQIFHQPEKYIFKQWTREAKIGAIYAIDEADAKVIPFGSLMSRHSRLLPKASALVDDASLTEGERDFLKNS